MLSDPFLDRLIDCFEAGRRNALKASEAPYIEGCRHIDNREAWLDGYAIGIADRNGAEVSSDLNMALLRHCH